MLGKWKMEDSMSENIYHFKDDSTYVLYMRWKEEISDPYIVREKYKIIEKDKVEIEPGNNFKKMEYLFKIHGDTLFMTNRTTGMVKYIRQK